MAGGGAAWQAADHYRASNKVYGQYDHAQVRVHRPGAQLGDSQGGTPFATQYNVGPQHVPKPKTPNDPALHKGCPFATDLD